MIPAKPMGCFDRRQGPHVLPSAARQAASTSDAISPLADRPTPPREQGEQGRECAVHLLSPSIPTGHQSSTAQQPWDRLFCLIGFRSASVLALRLARVRRWQDESGRTELPLSRSRGKAQGVGGCKRSTQAGRSVKEVHHRLCACAPRRPGRSRPHGKLDGIYPTEVHGVALAGQQPYRLK